MDQKLYKITTAMQMLDVCRATIYRMEKRGTLELIKIGSATRVTGASLDRVISAGRVKT